MEKIYIRDIGENGLKVEDTINQSLFELTEVDYLRLVENVAVDVLFKRFDSTVLGDVRIKTRYASSCCRTMEPVSREWTAHFELDYEIESGQEYIEVEDDIRQEILVRLPTRVLSDAEMKKEQGSAFEPDPEEESPPENMYRPFSGLKDLDA